MRIVTIISVKFIVVSSLNLLTMLTVDTAWAQSIDQLKERFATANNYCRGSSDAKKADKGCEDRERIGKILESRGYCMGAYENFRTRERYFPCGTPSMTMQDIIGKWTHADYPRDCKRGSETLLTVTPTSIETYESRCRIISHSAKGTTLTVNAVCNAEGETMRQRFTFKPEAGTIVMGKDTYEPCDENRWSR